MTREETLHSYLLDDLFTEFGYLSSEQAKTIKFSEPNSIKLIEVLKLAIEGEIRNENVHSIERKINIILNSQS